MDRTGLEFHFVFARTRAVHTVILTPYSAGDSTGGVKEEKGAVACLSKHRQKHGWTCPRHHGNPVFCSFEQSDVGSLRIIETQKSHWNVSGVDRRETGLFSGRKDVTVWAGKCFCFLSLFTLQKCFPSVFPLLLDATLRQQALFLVS